jgi:glycosyltransferase involved in cell wall biosynthesis
MAKKRLKVFVDAEVLIAPHFSGIGHYTLELLRALDRLIEDRPDIEVALGTFFRRVDKVRAYNFRNFKIVKSPFPLRVSNGLKIKGRQPPYDLFFGKRVYLFPNYTAWPLLFSKSASIVYDLSFEFFPQYVEPRNQKFLSDNVTKAVKWSEQVITISTNSQREISEFYKVPLKNIPIIYPGIDQSIFFRRPKHQVTEVMARYGVQGKYILFVGNIEPRKNLKNLLLAYEKLDPKLRSEYSLLLVGARGWLDGEIFSIIKRLRVSGNHIQQPLEYVDDDDRPALYSGASLFVYPSLYEGFGIPPVEAMACGVPVITSDNSSLPEAVGSAAKMIDAESVDQIAEAMTTVLNNDKLQKEMIAKGFTQADQFSWDKSARKLLDILQGVNGT